MQLLVEVLTDIDLLCEGGVEETISHIQVKHMV